MLMWWMAVFFSQACHVWYPADYELHRFLISVARVVVYNDDKGRTALDPIIGSAGSFSKKREVDRAVRDFAWLPGPVNLPTGGWQDCVVKPFLVGFVGKLFFIHFSFML